MKCVPTPVDGLTHPPVSTTWGSLTNVDKNYWTFEPGASISYISNKIGLELSAFAGADFNTENNDTD